MRYAELRQAATRPGRWALVYRTVDAAAQADALTARMRGAPVFGCTSSGGVFTPGGFERGAFALLGDEGDATVDVALRAANATSARRTAREAAQQITTRLGRRPDTLLLHATPGFEERILEGIDDAFDGSAPPMYGGSAADDDLSGRWQIFHGSESLSEGFLLVGFQSARPILGSFVAGYLPGKQRGTITRASGRIVHEIDGKPAAEVYDAWRGGALASALAKPRAVLADTTMHPLGRLVDRVGNVPRYLLSHPHEVRPDHALTLFTDVAVGDELAMMVGSEGGLLERTEQVVTRARGPAHRKTPIAGGILVYCGGCVMAIGERAKDVGKMYAKAIAGAPFVGAATFGEIGCFTGPEPTNRHGNLMCDTVLFT
jgi:hypothetical protein